MNKPITPFLSPDEVNRFWAKVAIGSADECWEWQATRLVMTNRNRQMPYGLFSLNQSTYRAHRVAFVIANGIDPGASFVLHNCPAGDNPACCNPEHLWLGDHVANMADMVNKGRQATGDRHNSRTMPERLPWGERNGHSTKPERTPRGESHKSSKLTDGQVREIRALYATGNYSLQEVGSRYDMTYGGIHSVIKRKTWKHVS